MARTARTADVIDRLAALAARRGTLTTDMLRRVVPLDTMPVEELAAIIAALEDRGVTVDVDPALLSPGARPSRPPGTTATAWPRPEPAPSGPSPLPPVTPLRPAAAHPAPGSEAAPQRSKGVTPIVLLALLVVIVLAFVWLSVS